jgi:signal transduction histidine kinase
VLGYAVCVVRFETILSRVVQNVNFRRSDVNIAMFDTTINDVVVNSAASNISLLYKDTNKEFAGIWQAHDVPVSIRHQTVTFFDRTYAVYFSFPDQYTRSLGSVLPTVVPSCVAAVLFLLNMIVLLLINDRKRRKEVQDGVRANQMLFFMNHEVRNPLNVIKGLVDFTLHVLTKEAEPPLEQCRADLEIVARTCEFLEHIVSDIRVLQEIQDDAVVFKLQACDIQCALQEIIRSCGPKMDENKQTTLHLHCPPGIVLQVDKFRLKQIMLNLITNAMKYTKQGRIDVTAVQEQDGVLITVQDTGIGIPQNRTHLIFHAYLQTGVVKDTGRYGQVGIGLYLVKSLANKMGWSVGYESTVGVGSTFFVKIPLAAEMLTGLDNDIENRAVPARAPTRKTSAQLHVLVK